MSLFPIPEADSDQVSVSLILPSLTQFRHLSLSFGHPSIQVFSLIYPITIYAVYLSFLISNFRFFLSKISIKLFNFVYILTLVQNISSFCTVLSSTFTKKNCSYLIIKAINSSTMLRYGPTTLMREKVKVVHKHFGKKWF